MIRVEAILESETGNRREDAQDALALVNARLLVYEEAWQRLVHVPATAVLIENGLIAEIGDDDDVTRLARGKGEVVDLQGATLAPGFIDAHVHAFACAMASTWRLALAPGRG